MTELVYAIDVSNWQPSDLTALIRQHHPTHVVVRLSTESEALRQHARRQLETAVAEGCTVSGYHWIYWDGDSPEAEVADALAVAAGFELRRLWMDCEGDNPGMAFVEDRLSRAVAQAEAQGRACGIYVGANWWRQNGNSHGFTRLPLWLADWDEVPNLDVDDLPGGWTKLGGKQWSTTNDTLDRDVFDAEVLRLPTTSEICAPWISAAADTLNRYEALKQGLRTELAHPKLSRHRLQALLDS
jgi:GH25 family lysozyme M1 (1,4-beta-N-acetylmuramidase)